MTKLKTLKDIEKLAGSKGLYVHIENIEREAIKVAKFFGDEMDLEKFNHFFNITEEDLQDD